MIASQGTHHSVSSCDHNLPESHCPRSDAPLHASGWDQGGRVWPLLRPEGEAGPQEKPPPAPRPAAAWTSRGGVPVSHSVQCDLLLRVPRFPH